MVTRLLLIVAAIGLFSCSSATQRVAGEPAGDALPVHLIVTDRGDELLEAWANGQPKIVIRSIGTAERGKFITSIVRFEGCAPDADGHCNATVTYRAYKPNGELYGHLENGELWIGKPAPERGASQLAAEYLGLVFEPSDPAGSYRIVAEVRDRNANRTAVVSGHVELK